MSRYGVGLLVCASVAAMAQAPTPQRIGMTWGLENTWSYEEVKGGRAEDEDAAVHKPGSTAKRYRAFAFRDRVDTIREPWLACIEQIMRLWDVYRANKPAPPGGWAADAERDRFREYLARESPKCLALVKRTAPTLYFDFTTATADQFVLERVEVTTAEFSGYAGGGFAEREAWYDILLSHRPGVKTYLPEPRLVFKEHGRLTLRLWSDNFQPNVGWIAPMGDYTIDIRFVFSVAGKTVTVSTGPFKIDV